MFKKILTKNDGIALVAVVIIGIIMAILTGLILATSTSQVQVTERTARRIRAQQFAKGVFWRTFMNRNNAQEPPNSICHNGQCANISKFPPGHILNPLDEDQYQVEVNP